MTKSYEYKDILNRLSDMQRVPYYAAACHDLVKAEMAIVALENERDALRTRLAEVEKDGRAIRRMLCVSVAHMPYMDDGEASDQEIDFLRDSPADIEKKLMERNLKKYAAMKEQA